jgi:hypothetical protein
VRRPENYVNGSGCRDVTPPVIQLLPPTRMVLSTCKCEALGGLMGVMPEACLQRDFRAELQVRRRGYAA